MKKPESVGIIGQRSNKCALMAAKKLAAFLKKKKIKFTVDRELAWECRGTPASRFSVDFAVFLGGDGTLLRGFRELNPKIPALGVNCGRHGALMEAGRGEMLSAMGNVLAGEYGIEKRARILPVVDGRRKPLALNEVELVTGQFGRIMGYELRVNGRLRLRDRADGVIIATPTGSTAHAYSAGGKKISPGRRVFEVVPINSMDNRGKVFVVGENSKITLKKFTEGCEVLIDGRVRVKAERGVRLEKGEPALFVRV